MTKGINRRQVLATGMAGAASLSMPFIGQAQAQSTVRLRIGMGHPPMAQPYGQVMAQFFVPELKKRAKAAGINLSIIEAYSGSVAKLAEIMGAVESGLLDIGAVVYPFESSRLFLQNFNYWIPFSNPDAVAVLDATRKTHDAIPELYDTFLKNKQRLLYLASTDNYGIGTSFEWNDLSELKGRKIAAAGPNLPWIKNSGAIPVQAGANDFYSGIQTGIYDGVIFHPAAYVGFKLHEVGKNFKICNLGSMAIFGITINEATWQKLPEALQKILLELSLEAEARSGAQANDGHTSALKFMRAEGVKVETITDQARMEWAESVKDLPGTMAKEADSRGLPGTKTVKTYLKFMAESGYETPVKYTL